jgi:hypothetical protein
MLLHEQAERLVVHLPRAHGVDILVFTRPSK